MTRVTCYLDNHDKFHKTAPAAVEAEFGYIIEEMKTFLTFFRPLPMFRSKDLKDREWQEIERFVVRLRAKYAEYEAAQLAKEGRKPLLTRPAEELDASAAAVINA